MDEFMTGFSEDVTPTRKKNPLFVMLAVCFLLIILIGIGFIVFGQKTVPKEFFNRYTDVDSLEKQIEKSAQFDFSELSESLKAKDLQAAYQMVGVANAKALKNSKLIDDLIAKTAKLKQVSINNSDQSLGQNIIKLFGLLDDRNIKLKKLVSTEAELFGALKESYEAQAAGAQPTSQINTDADVLDIQNNTKNIQDLDFQIDSVYQEIVKASGMQDIVESAGIILKRNSSNSDTVEPTIRYALPTSVPTPTIVPTLPLSPTPVASATPTIASSSAH